MTISISELEALRAKMTPGFAGRGGVGCPSCVMEHDVTSLLAAHRAMPALLALAKAALAWREAGVARRKYGDDAMSRSPFEIFSEEFREEAERLDAIIADRERELVEAVKVVRP